MTSSTVPRVSLGKKTVPAMEGSKAPVSIFVEETGKTGFAFLTDLADPRKLAQVNPGDAVELTPEGNRLLAFSNGMRIGIVEPRVAARLIKMMAEGNSVKEIACDLNLSVKTVEAHKFNLMRKLDIHNKAQLVQYAIQKKIIKIPNMV